MLILEKVNQAIGILQELGIDAWLTFARETSAGGDPVLPLIYGPHSLTWQSALLLSRSGERIAIVGRFDAIVAEQVGAYTEVIPYDQSLQPHLLAALQRLDPQQIALNFSANDVYADGLGHGLHQVLAGYLAGWPARPTPIGWSRPRRSSARCAGARRRPRWRASTRPWPPRWKSTAAPSTFYNPA